jgi:hypothetical protein
MTNAQAVIGVAMKNGDAGCEFHAVGCADIAKGNREVFAKFATPLEGAKWFWADQIDEETMTVAEAVASCKVMPCVKAVR